MIEILIEGKEPYPCQDGLQVEVIVAAIRESYMLQGGFITQDGTAMVPGQVISKGGIYQFKCFQSSNGPSIASPSLSTATLSQVPLLKVHGQASFIRFEGEIPRSVFYTAWEFSGGRRIPYIIKFPIAMTEVFTVSHLVLSLGKKGLEDSNLINMSVYSSRNSIHRQGIKMTRYCGTVAEFTERIIPPTDYVAHILDRIKTALVAIHGLGMIHCDIKPSNIFLDSDGLPFLGDFGSVVLHREGIDSFSAAFAVKEISPPISYTAIPTFDYCSLIILGLLLIRKLIISGEPIPIATIRNAIQIIRGDDNPAHKLLCELFDNHLSSLQS